MSAKNLSTVACDLIESYGNTAKNVIDAYRAGGERVVSARKASAVPARLAALDPGLQPDLEETGRSRLGVKFGMTDARTSAHHLHITGGGTALVTQAVLMRDRTFANIGNDLHIPVWVERKARGWGELVVVPDAQSAERTMLWPPHTAEGEVQFGFQPATLGSGQGGKGAMLDHDAVPLE